MNKDYISEFLEEFLGVDPDIDIDCCDHDLSVWNYIEETDHDYDFGMYELAEQYEEAMRFLDREQFPEFVKDAVYTAYHDKANEILLKFNDKELQGDIDDLVRNAREIAEEYRSMTALYNRQRL